jgi:hypothetical protein
VTSPGNERLHNILAVLGGVIFALLVVVAFIWLSDDDDGNAVTTVTTSATTTAPATTTTAEATTTTTAATTTTIEFEGDTSPKTNETISGDPGPNLTDVRIGDHPEDGFVRIVFDLTGEGTPFYVVGYQDPPFVETSGDEVAVDGTAFIHVTISPALTYDIDTFDPTYEGDQELRPGFDPIVEIQFIGDFEATMEWVIGLDGEHPFTVAILQDPLRVVIDIAK